ncbi:MAG: hypothetical protein EZS28_047848 [Streblomastix strix]|uniref:Uncharacterized protein n=1 Tax=Streblomastix strix TaxID=222440 RepID=A0A5J4TGN1_9EUKA|nr:MAG: hypothetical protein EZS28_047848 [Streblomastix strix]
MQSKLKVNEIVRAIVSFTDSYTQNKQGEQNEQPESESIPSITKIYFSLQFLQNQILKNNTRKQVIQIPKLLKSLTTLVTFRLGTHIDLDVDNQRLKVRSWSRQCLIYIQVFGDEQDQSELVRQGYGRVTSITFSTAGGQGEEQDYEISNQLYRISRFLRELHEGRNEWKPYFQTLPLLVRNTEEQMEEEGVDEELDTQMNNNGHYGYIKEYANEAKEATLNRFIHRRRR